MYFHAMYTRHGLGTLVEVKNTNTLPKVVIRRRLFSKEIRHIPLYSFTAYTTISAVAAVSGDISTVGPKIPK